MDRRGEFVASLLEASPRAFAAGAVARLRQGSSDDLGDDGAFSLLLADMELRVRSLAESLAAGRPELLRLDVEWLRETYAARGLSLALVEQGLRCLRQELDESLPKDAARLAVEHLDAALVGLDAVPAPPASPLEAEGPHADLARKLAVAALEGRGGDAAALVLGALEEGSGLAEIHDLVIGPTQVEIGRLWQMGEIHAAEEHLASRIVETSLVLLHTRAPRAKDTGRSVLTASVPGNLHDIGARMIAGCFEAAGWRSYFLGADTPGADLVLAVDEFAPDVVALSVGLGFQIQTTARLVADLGARSGPPVPVLVGGRVFRAIPDLWKTVGADATARSGAEAVREAERLLRDARAKRRP